MRKIIAAKQNSYMSYLFCLKPVVLTRGGALKNFQFPGGRESLSALQPSKFLNGKYRFNLKSRGLETVDNHLREAW